MSSAIDISGEKFGRLTAIEAMRINGYTKWLCKCECGKELITRTNNLVSGATKSCGCLNHEIRINQKTFLTHGMSKEKQFTIWTNMKCRCYDKNNKEYKNYGGRGITVCDKWMTLVGFWDDMKEGYKKGLTLDRIDVNGNYCKENCKWSTLREQANNRRSNTFYTAFGVTDTLANLCRRFNAKYKIVFQRIKYQHLDLEIALTK